MSLLSEHLDGALPRMLVRPVARNRPNNPLRPRPARGPSTEADGQAENTASDGGSTAAEMNEAAHERNLLRRLIQIERRCLITGTSSCALDAVHLIPVPQPQEGQTKEGFLVSKRRIEKCLTHIGFNRGERFEFDSFCNLVLLCPNFQEHLDKYGTIALTPSYGHLALLRNRLKVDNLTWDQACTEQPNAPRPMSNSVYDTTALDWSVLVLHQDDFLPDGQPLPVLRPEHRAGPVSAQHWGFCRLEHHPEFGFPVLVISSSAGLPANAASLALRTQTPLSLFAVIVNLHDKVAACAPERTAAIRPLLDELIELIFYRPPGFALADDAIDAINISSTGALPPDTPTEEHARSAEDADEDARVSAAVAMWGASLSENCDDPDRASEDDGEDGDANAEESFVPGVTMPEYLTLLHRVMSPSEARTRDRAIDVGLLFFGTQPYERPPRNPIREPETSSDV